MTIAMLVLIGFALCQNGKQIKLQLALSYVFGGLSVGITITLLQLLDRFSGVGAILLGLVLLLVTLIALRLLFQKVEARFAVYPKEVANTPDPGLSPIADKSSAADTPLPEGEPVYPLELQGAIAALEQERYQAAWDLALPHQAEITPTPLFADATRVCGLASSGLEQWEASYGYWLRLFEHAEPTALSALQLATTSIKRGQLAQGEAWYQKMESLAASFVPDHCISYITALQQEGLHQTALPYLAKLKDLYESLSITDATFLAIRSMPLFSVFLQESLHTVKVALPIGSAQDWYLAMCPHLDQEGQEQVRAFVKAHF